jgi:Ribbon-helix-helix protein, copG family
MINDMDADFDRKEPRGKRKAFLGCDVPVELMARTKEQARLEERPVSAIVRRALAAYLAREDRAA